MASIPDAVDAVSSLLKDGIDKIWPDPTDKAKIECMLMQAKADAAVSTMKQEMSIALAEAQSSDKYTSRARPGFLYTMYILILWGIPFSIIAAFKPELAVSMAKGFQAWLAAVPDMLWQVFGWCFGAYAGGRSIEKIMPLVAKK